MYPSPINGPNLLASAFLALCSDDIAAGSRSGEFGVDEVRCNRTYTNRIKVEVSPKSCGPLQVINACGVHLGDTYRYPLFAASATENDTGAFAQRIRAENVSEPGPGSIVQWAVTVDYGPFDVAYWLGTSHISSGIVDPTYRQPEVYWDTAKFEMAKPNDEGTPQKPYVNTVNDPLLDPPMLEQSRPVLKFVRNEPYYDAAYASTFQDTTNNAAFLGFAANTVKCRMIKGERFFDADWGHYFTVTYEFEFNIDPDTFGFGLRVLNTGYRYKKGGTGAVINIVDGNGQPTNDAKPLKSNGDLALVPSDFYFLQFTQFPQVDFSLLNIPPDVLNIA